MKKYIICNDDSDNPIPHAWHVKKNDAVCKSLGISDEYDNFAAAMDAVQDGVKLIVGIPGIPNDFYVDEPENRQAIEDFVRKNRKIYCFLAENTTNEVVDIRIPAFSETEARNVLSRIFKEEYFGFIDLDRVEDI